MKKCLVGWSGGSFNFRTKWTASQIAEISAHLTSSNSTMPKETHRAVRPLDSLKFWKGIKKIIQLYVS